MAPHAVPDAYVALCLRLRRLVPAFVDAGAVDPAIRRRVADEPPPTAAELVRQAGRLAAELPDAGLEPSRGRFLAAQLRAVEWRSRRLAGQHVTFRSELRECLDIEVAPGEPDAYRSAHRELAALLPGPGSVAERLATHHCRDAVPPGRLADAVDALTAALRHRVAGRYGLPPAMPSSTGSSTTFRGAPCTPTRAITAPSSGSMSAPDYGRASWPALWRTRPTRGITRSAAGPRPGRRGTASSSA